MKVMLMNKNDLVEAFSVACMDMAMFMDEYLLPNIHPESPVAAPLFEETAIEDIHEWWETDNHLQKYKVQVAKLYQSDWTQHNQQFQNAVAELQQNENLIAQYRNFINEADKNDDYLKYLPHHADYASMLTETDGYKELKRVCDAMSNVSVRPLIMVDADKNDLVSAFCLSVHFETTDNMPLAPKIESAIEKGVFRAAENRIKGYS